MANYAIGDVQGCYDALLRLLQKIQFNDKEDRLWFVGDLVNRGPESLAVLRFVKNLPLKPHITLGNHDLHLLNKLFVHDKKGRFPTEKEDSLQDILAAEDAEELGDWLRHCSILHHDTHLNIVMCHAGIAPTWDLEQAKQCAYELEQALRGPEFQYFLANMYGNKPDAWSDALTGIERLRVITNYFTRMRFCDRNGHLFLEYKGTIAQAPAHLTPWFLVKNRQPLSADLIFGHWAALQGQCNIPGIYALDTGYIWGGTLTALRLEDRQVFSIQSTDK